MFARRTALAVALLIFPFFVFCDAERAGAVEVANLADQLNHALKTSTRPETDFVDDVVLEVEVGRLPLSVVKSTLQWARQKKPKPFPYFARAIRLRAAPYGVRL